MNRHIYTWLLCACSAVFSACDGGREVEGEETVAEKRDTSDTITVARTDDNAEQELDEFRDWLNTQADKGDTAIRREWPRIREELRRRNAALEEDFDSLSARSQEEFRSLQERYRTWEERQERRQQQPLQKNQIQQWQQQLLREYANLENIQVDQMREAYLTFMGAVRTKRRNWTMDDWDYVDYVYGELNQRRRQLEGELSGADKLKIRTLQAEYLTLEGAADTKSLLQGVDR